MSRGQLPRTPEYFPRMKHRRAGRLRGPTVSEGGGYVCSEHGIWWKWGRIGKVEYEQILAEIDGHEAWHEYPDYYG